MSNGEQEHEDEEPESKVLVATDAKTGQLLGFRDVTTNTEADIAGTKEAMTNSLKDGGYTGVLAFTIVKGPTVTQAMFPRRPQGS
jgi:hypothetical protein